MISFLLFVTMMQNDIDFLPSPAYVAQCIGVRGNPKEYNEQLIQSSKLLSKIKVQSETKIRDLVRSWWKANKFAHEKLRRKYASKEAVDEREIELTSEMSKFDLTKLDVILVTRGQKPLFHTERWLRTAYSIRSEEAKPFEIPKTPKIPWVLGGSKGGKIEPLYASFVPFYAAESKLVTSWLESQKWSGRPAPMTVQRMLQKVDRQVTESAAY